MVTRVGVKMDNKKEMIKDNINHQTDEKDATKTQHHQNYYRSAEEQLADPYYQYYASQQSGDREGMRYEMQRAQNQMNHYFDLSRYRQQHQNMPNKSPATDPNTATTISTGPGVRVAVPSAAAPPPTDNKRPTKKQLEAFRKRKEERKRIRNRWLYE